MISSSQSRPPFKVIFSVFVSVRVWEKIIMKSFLRSHPLFKVRERLAEKICFLSGIARMRGGEGLARIKKYTLYIPL